MNATTAPSERLREAGADSSEAASLRVLIADKFEASGLAALESLGCEVQLNPDITADTLAEAAAEHDPDVLIVRSTKVKAPVLDAAKRLSLIIRAGAGYDTIDVARASACGVFVANCPGKNSSAVAELAWALILSCDRRVPDQTIDLRAGKWAKKEYGKAAGLKGRTLGVIGLGRIGQEVAERGKAFGMSVVAWSRSLTQERADKLGLGYCSSIINLAKMADVVSINLAANDDTKHLINSTVFDAMKNGAIIINTSRGSILDEEALQTAIREKGIRAGLDVYATEPAAGDTTFADPIVNEPGVYGTHHVAASTTQAQEAIAAETVRIVGEYVRSGKVLNCVNRAGKTVATRILTVRHHNRPGVLAQVFYTLGQAGINVEEMENIIYQGEEAACARIQLDRDIEDEHITAIENNEHVISASVTAIE